MGEGVADEARGASTPLNLPHLVGSEEQMEDAEQAAALVSLAAPLSVLRFVLSGPVPQIAGVEWLIFVAW